MIFPFQNNYGLLSLEVLNAKASQAGTYTVEATNEEGTSSCSATLTVDGKLFNLVLNTFLRIDTDI